MITLFSVNHADSVKKRPDRPSLAKYDADRGEVFSNDLVHQAVLGNVAFFSPF
jgi:hypothetical protein